MTKLPAVKPALTPHILSNAMEHCVAVDSMPVAPEIASKATAIGSAPTPAAIHAAAAVAADIPLRTSALTCACARVSGAAQEFPHLGVAVLTADKRVVVQTPAALRPFPTQLVLVSAHPPRDLQVASPVRSNELVGSAG